MCVSARVWGGGDKGVYGWCVFCVCRVCGVYDQSPEKEDRMFGSLIIQLPSEYTGGELVINHKGREKVYMCARLIECAVR